LANEFAVAWQRQVELDHGGDQGVGQLTFESLVISGQGALELAALALILREKRFHALHPPARTGTKRMRKRLVTQTNVLRRPHLGGGILLTGQKPYLGKLVIADCSLVDGVMVIRTGEAAAALTTVLASILALSPASTRSRSAIKQVADSFRKKLVRQVRAAEREMPTFSTSRRAAFTATRPIAREGGRA
jgi:hypothetical protein